jgi:hypothetical protein
MIIIKNKALIRGYHNWIMSETNNHTKIRFIEEVESIDKMS